MRKLQINKEHRTLIESVIKENPRFRGNEELIDLFCEAIYKKSYLLIDAIRDTERLKRHLVSICETSMRQILKEKQKFDETKAPQIKVQETKNFQTVIKSASSKGSIVSVKKTPLEEERVLEQQYQKKRAQEEIINLKEEIQRSEKYDNVDMLIDPLEFCPQKKVSKRAVEKFIQIVKIVSEQFPKKRYYDIFNLRYIRGFNQSEIARELRISQAELSKRFVELIKLARESI